MKKWSRVLFGNLLVVAGFALADTKEKPVSLSYKNILSCYPELKNEAHSLKVDLTVLKEDSDRKFVTMQSLLRYRQVILKDGAGSKRRLKLSASPGKMGKMNYVLSLEKLDAKNSGTPIAIPQSQRINTKQKDLDQYFLNQDVLEDERSYFDTKLNGVNLSYKLHFQKIFELEIAEPKRSKRLFCEDKNELGVVCTCFHK